MIAKIIFELTVLVGIAVDLFTVFSNKIHKKLFESIDETKELEKELDELLSPRVIMIIDNVLFAIISIIMLFYYEHFVGFRLAFGIILLSFVGSLVDNAVLFANDDYPIVTKKSYKVLTKILSAVEIFMLVIIGYVGWIK